MRQSLFNVAISGALLAGGLFASAAMAQDYGATPHVYHLHAPSSYQQGCWGLCTCPLSNEAAMRGSFTLSLVTVGNATDFYAISGVDWRVPMLGGQPFNAALAGSGTFNAGQAPFNPNQFAALDLTISPPPGPWTGVQQFLATPPAMMRTAAPPVIRIQLANSETGCPGVRLLLVASWYRTDWDASGTITAADIFGFLDGWFAGSPFADYNGAGGVEMQDMFDFLNGWFAGA